MDEVRARLRLELSDREIRCPLKASVIALQRCQEAQRETDAAGKACTCGEYTGRGLPPVVEVRPLRMVRQAPEPPAAPTTRPPLKPDHRQAIAELARRRRAQLAPVPPPPPEPEPPAPAEPPPSSEERPMPKISTEDLLAQMRHQPLRDWTRDDVAELRGSTPDAAGQVLQKLLADGLVKRTGRGIYHAVGEKPARKRPAVIEMVATAPAGGAPDEVQRLIAEECDAVKALLLAKNARYGNSALDPVRIFSRADGVEQIKVRIDDKLSRLARGAGEEMEDVEQDLLGYFVLLRVARRRAAVVR
jgi:hypothetical protein